VECRLAKQALKERGRWYLEPVPGTVLWGLALLAVLAVAAAVRWELLATRSLWYDEGYSLFVARMGGRQILQFLKANDAHPAGYYVLLSFWIQRFGEGLLVARLPSFVFGVAAVALTWLVASRLHGPASAAVAALLVAIHPFQVMASNELRMYSLLTVLVLAAVLAAVRAIRGGDSWALLLGVLWAAVGYTSYYGLLAVVGMAAALWTGGHRKVAGLAAATGLALYLPWLPYLAGFWRANPQLWTRETLWWGYPVELLAAQAFGGYWPDTFTYHTSFRGSVFLYVPLLVPYGLFAAATVALAGRERSEGLRLVRWTWMTAFVAILGLSLAMGWAAAYPRHLTFLQPLAACWVAVGLVELSRALRLRSRAAGLGVLWLLSLQGPALVAMQSDPRYQSYRYDLAARFVQSAFRAGDAVVYVPGGTSLAFEYYFRPPGPRVEVRIQPRPYRPEEWRPRFDRGLRALVGQVQRVWTVTTAPAPPAAEAALKEALGARGYRVVGERAFPGLKVSLAVRAR